MAEEDDNSVMWVSCGVTYREGEPGWVPDLRHRSSKDRTLVREICLFYQERYDGEWMPDKLVDAIKWLQDKLAQVPEQYRNDVKIEIDSQSSYEDSHYASIEISYWRPATEEEIGLWQADQDSKAAEKTTSELREYLRLKEKFGDG